MDNIQRSGRLKKAISRAGKRLEELTSDPKVNIIVMIVADRYGKSASPFLASAIHKAVSENTSTKREIILEHLGKEVHHKGCTFDHACKACVTGGEGGFTDKIVRAHNNIKLNTENMLCEYFLEAIDQKVDQRGKERKAEKKSKEHPKEPKEDKPKKKHKAEKEREETPPKAAGSKEEKKKKRKTKSPEGSRERSRGRSRELRTIQAYKQSVVRYTQKGMDPSGLKDLDEEQLIALQGAIDDSLQSRRDESVEGAQAAKKIKEEPKEEATKEEEEELPDYEASEDEKPPEKTPKAVTKKRVLSSESEETDESLKKQIREDLKSDSEGRPDEGVQLKERPRRRSRTPPRTHGRSIKSPSRHQDDDWWGGERDWRRRGGPRQIYYQPDDWRSGSEKGKSKGKGKYKSKDKSKDKSRSQSKGYWKWQPTNPKTVKEASEALEKACKEIEVGRRVTLTWHEIKELGVLTRMCSKPNPRHTKINISPEVRGYRKWTFVLKEDGDDWEEIETNKSAEDETVFDGDEKPQTCVVFLVPSEVIGTGATAMYYVNMVQTSRAQTQMLVEGHQVDQMQQGAYMELAAAAYKALDRPGPNRHLELVKNLIRSAHCCFVHFAPPCGTSSRARLIQRKGRWNPPIVRTDQYPDGLPNLSGTLAIRVAAANKLYGITCDLIQFCLELKKYFSVENPGRSFMWQTTPFVKLMSTFPLLQVLFHHCRYGSSRRKLTKLLHNIPTFQTLESFCQGDHQHDPWGRTPDGKWSTAEETAYPWELCKAIAAKLLLQLQTDGYDCSPPVFALQESSLQTMRASTDIQPRQGLPVMVSEFESVQKPFHRCTLTHKLQTPQYS